MKKISGYSLRNYEFKFFLSPKLTSRHPKLQKKIS